MNNSPIPQGVSQHDLRISGFRLWLRRGLSACPNANTETQLETIVSAFSISPRRFFPSLRFPVIRWRSNRRTGFPLLFVQPGTLHSSNLMQHTKSSLSERFKTTIINSLRPPFHGHHYGKGGFQDVGKFFQKSGKTRTQRERNE